MVHTLRSLTNVAAHLTRSIVSKWGVSGFGNNEEREEEKEEDEEDAKTSQPTASQPRQARSAGQTMSQDV